MAILQKLKSLLGLGDSRSERRRDRDVAVTVEREGGQSDDATESNAAVPGDPADVSETDAVSPTGDEEPAAADLVEGDETAEERDGDGTDEEADLEESAAAGSDAAAATDSLTQQSERPDEAAEPAEATGPSEADAAPTDEKAGESVQPVPVDDIKGIGPAYSDRLADAGVETVRDLAAADAEALAEETDISATRIQGWIDRAEVR